MQPPLPFEPESREPGAQTARRHAPSSSPPRKPRDTGTSAPLTFADGCQPDFIRHPRARRYIVRVRTDGSVRVTIPRWGTKREALAFAVRQRAWIDKQRAKAERARAQPRLEMPPEQQRLLRKRAARELPARLHELAATCGLAVSKVSIRNQRWRWGSCSRNGHICLNWRLVTMPDWVRDYVLIHELMHLKRLDHSPAFWRLVASVCADYVQARRWLRAHQELLLN